MIKRRSPKEKILAKIDAELDEVPTKKLTGSLLFRVDCSQGGLLKLNITTDENVDISNGKSEERKRN